MSLDSRNEAVRMALEIPGWMESDELAWLHEMAGRLPFGGRWVEVGTWKGRSFLATALGLPRMAKIAGVDTFLGSPESTRHDEARAPGNPVRVAFGATMDRIRELRPDLTVICVEGDSAKVAKEFFVWATPNAVFVDGSHAEEAVLADIAAWGHMVRPGGLLAGHDADMIGVQRALDAQSWESTACPGRIWRRA